MKEEIEELKAKVIKLEAQLWVANDRGLRTYDGMTTRYENRIKELEARVKELENGKD